MFRAALYKSTRPGLPGLYNILVRWWTRGKYSHGELIFSDGVAASSSFMDGGVRFKHIDFKPDKWDFIELPDSLEPAARAWFKEHEGEKYDLMGNLHFIFMVIPASENRWSCLESVMDSLGFLDSWRYEPSVAYSALSAIGVRL